MTIEANKPYIITNTSSERDSFRGKADLSFGGGGGSSEVILTPKDIEALREGKCVAFDDGEYSTFISLCHEKNAKCE